MPQRAHGNGQEDGGDLCWLGIELCAKDVAPSLIPLKASGNFRIAYPSQNVLRVVSNPQWVRIPVSSKMS